MGKHKVSSLKNGVKGIYPHGTGFKVRKYGFHIGVYPTLSEAEEAVRNAEQEHEVSMHLDRYSESKKWLQDNGYQALIS